MVRLFFASLFCFASAGFTLVFAPLALAAAAEFKPGVDSDQDGSLNVEEFVMALGEREYGRRDTNKDNVMSKSEWLGQGGEFQTLTFNRFNANGDDEMSADELVEVFTWIFSRRDKNKDGQLSPSEAPAYLLQK